MASINGVIFSESMADFLANPVDILFGSMTAASTASAACLVTEGNAVTTHQQIETDLSKKTHPPTPIDLIAGIDRVVICSPIQSKSVSASSVLARLLRPPTCLLACAMPLA
jgi:hypothetical protein